MADDLISRLRNPLPPKVRDDLPYEEWLQAYRPRSATAALAERHHRVWRWISQLKKGVRPRPIVECWPRGGAKSSTIELGATFIANRGVRKFVLYVSGTQDQADEHVKTVANHLGEIGIQREIGLYGQPKGWRRNQIRAEGDFNVSAIGLDVAARGVKLDDYRPDWIIFDDLDARTDTADTTKKKIAAMTQSIMPAGSIDCAYTFIQNLILEDGICSQLFNDSADFLLDRVRSNVIVAVEGLKTEVEKLEDGGRRIKVVGGTPTWEGQNLETVEHQISSWGLTAFLRESQQEVKGAAGFFFDEAAFQYIEEDEVPTLVSEVRAWDLASTQGGGDFTTGVRMGKSANGNRYVLDVEREQYSPDRVRKLISATTANDQSKHIKGVRPRLPRDPAQAGKFQEDVFRELLSEYDPIIEPVIRSKAVRAESWADAVNSYRVFLVRTPWNRKFVEEHRKFRADEKHEFDDQVDAAADAFNELENSYESTAPPYQPPVQQTYYTPL